MRNHRSRCASTSGGGAVTLFGGVAAPITGAMALLSESFTAPGL